MLTLIESPNFIKHAKGLKLSDNDIHDIINLLAARPDAGTALGVGLYKIRIGRKGGGKSGGFRIIYFYRLSLSFVYLLDIYAKSNQANASAADMKALQDAARKIEKDIK